MHGLALRSASRGVGAGHTGVGLWGAASCRCLLMPPVPYRWPMGTGTSQTSGIEVRESRVLDAMAHTHGHARVQHPLLALAMRYGPYPSRSRPCKHGCVRTFMPPATALAFGETTYTQLLRPLFPPCTPPVLDQERTRAHTH